MRAFFIILALVTVVALSQTREVVNVGASVGDTNSDTARSGFVKLNNNDEDLFQFVYTNKLLDGWRVTNMVGFSLNPSLITTDALTYVDTDGVLSASDITITKATQLATSTNSLQPQLDARAVQVATLTDLIALGAAGVRLASTLGYHAAGDGGAGTYRWTNALPSGVTTNTVTWFAGSSGFWNRIDSPAREAAPGMSDQMRLWSTPPQPGARDDGVYVDIGDWGFGAGFNAWNEKTTAIVTNLWQPLLARHPEVSSQEVMGMDQSGVHPIWRYVIDPGPSAERTVVITAGVHGTEKLAVLYCYRFFYYLLEHWQDYPELWYARWKVKWVIMPCVNPAGFNANPITRQNSRGVDLNRNSSYNHAAFQSYHATFDPDTDQVTAPTPNSLTITNGSQVRFYTFGGTLPTGIQPATVTNYWKVGAGDTYQLSSTDMNTETSIVSFSGAGSETNFAYYNPPFHPNFKGVEPWSEAESQYVKATIDANPKAVSYIDMHDFGGPSPHSDYTAFGPHNSLPSSSAWHNRIIAAYKTAQEVYFLAGSSGSSFVNYSVQQHGMTALIPESASSPGGPSVGAGNTYGSEQWNTHHFRWYANVLIQAALRDRNANSAFAEPQAYMLGYSFVNKAETYKVTSSSYQTFTGLKFRIPITASGIVHVNGTVSYANTGSGGTDRGILTQVLLLSGAGAYQQADSGGFGYYEAPATILQGSGEGSLYNGRITIPFAPVVTHVTPSFTGPNPETQGTLLLIDPQFKITTGTATPTITRMNISVLFIPTGGVPLRIWEGPGIITNSAARIYPSPTWIELDDDTLD